jgi:hypothetical protein
MALRSGWPGTSVRVPVLVTTRSTRVGRWCPGFGRRLIYFSQSHFDCQELVIMANGVGQATVKENEVEMAAAQAVV